MLLLLLVFQFGMVVKIEGLKRYVKYRYSVCKAFDPVPLMFTYQDMIKKASSRLIKKDFILSIFHASKFDHKGKQNSLEIGLKRT